VVRQVRWSTRKIGPPLWFTGKAGYLHHRPTNAMVVVLSIEV
jgi:hypothetical protein